jgi:hypothetical protein
VSADRNARREAAFAKAEDRSAAILGLIRLGPAADTLGLPSSLIDLAGEHPALRRRLTAVAARRLGLDAAALARGARDLPRGLDGVEEAAMRFGLAVALAGRPRIFPKDEYERLVASFGAAAVAFALRERLTGAKVQALIPLTPERIGALGRGLLGRALRTAGHPMADFLDAALGAEGQHARDFDPRWSSVALAALAEVRDAPALEEEDT